MGRSAGFFEALIGDGRPLLMFTGLILLLSGLFVITQSALGHFLPHDVVFLGLDADELTAFFGGRVTLFMFHDRVAFGGSIIAVAILYLWLALFPLRMGAKWAWWAFVASGLLGFGSFMTYLGYGYLDTWHGVATLLLFPFFLVGLWKTRELVAGSVMRLPTFTFRIPASRADRGKVLIHFMAVGLLLGGLVIMTVGMTTVFVPQDLRYMAIQGCKDLDAITPKLVPLIAHDRSAFGGGLATIGLLLSVILLFSDLDKALWQALLVTLIVGFSSAIGIHFVIGYTDHVHLLPAYAGAGLAALGLALTWGTWRTAT